MDYFDEEISPKDKLLQILRLAKPSAVEFGMDDFLLRLLACEALLEEKNIGENEILAKMRDPALEAHKDDIYIDLMAKILSCE